MNVLVLPELFVKHSQFNSLHNLILQILLNKYKHLIHWSNNPSILEFGFADGGTSEAALQPLIPLDCKEFIAADVSPNMVEYAKKHVKLHRLAKVVQLNISSEKLPAEFTNRFDHIFSFFTFHCIPKISASKAFKNIYEMLKPGGETFHIFLMPTPLDHIFFDLSKHSKWGKYNQDSMLSPYYLSKNREESCKTDLANAGFQNIELRVDEFVYEFANDDAWKEHYVAINASYTCIPPEERNEYLQHYFEEIKNKALIKSESDKEPPKIKFSTFVISAKKNI